MRHLILFSLLFLSANTHAANLPDFPFVVSSGVAEKQVAPDEATIHMSFLAFNEDSGIALDELNKASEQVFAVLQKYDIDIKKLEAKDIRKNTKRNRDKNYSDLDILGYETSRSMRLNLDNLAQYPLIVNDLISINNLSHIETEFDTRNRDQYEAELMHEAGKDARDKAELMAKSLGAKVKSVFAISQTSNFGNFFATFGTSDVSARFDMDAAGTNDSKMLVPEYILVSQRINVVFRIK